MTEPQVKIPTFEEHQAYFEESHNLVEVSNSAFNRVAAEYNNIYAVGAFGVIDPREPYNRYIFVDKDLFNMPRPSNPEEGFEDIKAFVIYHEMTELYALLVDKISGIRPVAGIDTEHDELARHTHLKLAHEARLLDKMVEFHILVQLICQRQIESYYGRPHYHGPDTEISQIIGRTLDIAERIRQEAAITENEQ